MKIYLCGQRLFGAAVYALCKELGHTVVGVCAPLLNSSGSGWDRLREAARKDQVPIMTAGLLRADLMPEGVDVILAAHSHDFISQKTRNKTRLGALGYHPSLLPLHRGRDAVRWTIKMRDRVAGGTVYWLNECVDGGDIAAQAHVFVRPDDTADSLWRDQLFPLGLQLFAQVLGDLEEGRIVAIPQDPRLATFEPSIGRPPIMRPDLPQLGPPPEGFQVQKRRDYGIADQITEQLREGR